MQKFEAYTMKNELVSEKEIESYFKELKKRFESFFSHKKQS